MLPERLSNDLCSLRPREDKLTFAAVFEMDEKGKIKKEWFGRTIIHSDVRFSYEEAQVILESGQGVLAEELRFLNDIAKKLRIFFVHRESQRQNSLTLQPCQQSDFDCDEEPW